MKIKYFEIQLSTLQKQTKQNLYFIYEPLQSVFADNYNSDILLEESGQLLS